MRIQFDHFSFQNRYRVKPFAQRAEFMLLLLPIIAKIINGMPTLMMVAVCYYVTWCFWSNLSVFRQRNAVHLFEVEHCRDNICICSHLHCHRTQMAITAAIGPLERVHLERACEFKVCGAAKSRNESNDQATSYFYVVYSKELAAYLDTFSDPVQQGFVSVLCFTDDRCTRNLWRIFFSITTNAVFFFLLARLPNAFEKKLSEFLSEISGSSSSNEKKKNSLALFKPETNLKIRERIQGLQHISKLCIKTVNNLIPFS